MGIFWWRRVVIAPYCPCIGLIFGKDIPTGYNCHENRTNLVSGDIIRANGIWWHRGLTTNFHCITIPND